jgi:uncharacterized protein RhaS with RHS repeats
MLQPLDGSEERSIAMDRTNLLDMIEVMDEELRYNAAAALVARRTAQREVFTRKARQSAAAIRVIRQELANKHGGRSRRRIDACIERILETQIELTRTAME